MRPDRRHLEEVEQDALWLEGIDIYGDLPSHPSFSHDILIDPVGVNCTKNCSPTVNLCPTCFSSLKNNKTPPHALANHMFLGDVPPPLSSLTMVEEALIAWSCCKTWIVQLPFPSEAEKAQDKHKIRINKPGAQYGFKGHIITYPQDTMSLEHDLPVSLHDMQAVLCVIFVSAEPPSKEWLQKNSELLLVCRDIVRTALHFLKSHNPYYRSVNINETSLEDYPSNDVIPVHIELSDSADQSLSAGYNQQHDSIHETTGTVQSETSNNQKENASPQEQVPFASLYNQVVVTDVESSAPGHQLRAAAIRHIKQGGSHIQVSHSQNPCNEFYNPDLLPMIYPTLFPYGLGGFEDSQQKTSVSLKAHMKHLFSLASSHFRKHHSFCLWYSIYCRNVQFCFIQLCVLNPPRLMSSPMY